jgi:hypothetical protein
MRSLSLVIPASFWQESIPNFPDGYPPQTAGMTTGKLRSSYYSFHPDKHRIEDKNIPARL